MLVVLILEQNGQILLRRGRLLDRGDRRLGCGVLLLFHRFGRLVGRGVLGGFVVRGGRFGTLSKTIGRHVRCQKFVYIANRFQGGIPSVAWNTLG